MVDKAMTIGERLEEARKRKGISIREAAEATKVRGDYLLAMENNSFEISLPEIYIRGFLKIYVNYLRLESEKLMAEYDAMRAAVNKNRLHAQQMRREAAGVPGASGAAAAGQSAGHVQLGHMDAAGEEEPQHILAGPSPLPPGTRALGNAWLRPVIIGVGALVIVVAIVLAAMFFLGRHHSSGGSDDLSSLSVSSRTVRTLTLHANDVVTVWVIRKSDGQRIFSDTLSAGQAQKIDVAGTVEVRYSNGRALQVERDGKLMGMSEPGMGKNIVE